MVKKSLVTLGIVILLIIGVLAIAHSRTPGNQVFYTSGGRRVEAFLYRPQGAALPAILYLHGGTSGFQGDGYMKELQAWGFVVLAINYPGEGASQGQQGNPLQENQAALDAVAYLKHLPYVNPQKIAVVGDSHGAGISLKTIEATSVAAAVDAYGPVDARSICQYWGQQCAQISAEYFDARSVLHPEKITTPLLILHGGKDQVVPVSQSDMLAQKLQSLNQVFLYKKYPDAPHGFLFDQSSDARAARQEVLDWLNRYLK